MISDIFKKLKPFVWFAPGFLLWAAFPPLGEKTDVLFALAPLMWLSRQGHARESAKRWFQSGAFFWVATLAWMPAIVKNGGPWPLVVLGWGALAAYCALYFAAYGYLSGAYWGWSRTWWTRLLGVLIVEPILWCGIECVRSRLFGGFAWNQLGVVPANGGFGLPAALGGVYLLSAVVILINGTLAGIAERMVRSIRKLPVDRLRSVETVLAFAIVWGIYSVSRTATPMDVREEASVKVAMIQRNFACVFCPSEENPYDVHGPLLERVAELQPDLVVLSESALCDVGRIGGSGAAGFAQWVANRTHGAALLAGGGRRDAQGREFNSAALYSAVGCQIYDKVHLVPFGEFIPGDKLIPALQKLAPVGSCTPGEVKLLELNGHKFGVAICFEDTDSALIRQFADLGAEFLVFITNDSWFSQSHEPVQHAWQAVARSIETGLPVVRVGNSGVTGSIRPDGRADWLTGADGFPLVDCRGTMFDRLKLPAVPVHGGLTPYVRWGDGPLLSCFSLLLLMMLLIKYRHYYEKRRYLSLEVRKKIWGMLRSDHCGSRQGGNARGADAGPLFVLCVRRH